MLQSHPGPASLLLFDNWSLGSKTFNYKQSQYWRSTWMQCKIKQIRAALFPLQPAEMGPQQVAKCTRWPEVHWSTNDGNLAEQPWKWGELFVTALFAFLLKHLLKKNMLYFQAGLVQQTQVQRQHQSLGKRGSQEPFVEVCSVPSTVWTVLQILTIILSVGLWSSLQTWKN